jgi:hypothetical protein
VKTVDNVGPPLHPLAVTPQGEMEINVTTQIGGFINGS